LPENGFFLSVHTWGLFWIFSIFSAGHCCKLSVLWALLCHMCSNTTHEFFIYSYHKWPRAILNCNVLVKFACWLISEAVVWFWSVALSLLGNSAKGIKPDSL
jgi:hypothetical protein